MPAPAISTSYDAIYDDQNKTGLYWRMPLLPKKIWQEDESTYEEYKINLKDIITSTPRVKVFKSKVVNKQLFSIFTKQDLFKEICSFKTLVSNWDGYGALPLETESAANAMYIISSLENSLIETLTHISPNPHGTVSLTWENNKTETLVLEIGNKEMAYYVDSNNQETKFFDNIEITDVEISKLAACIARVF